MLGLYLDTLIIGHKLCNMLSILNEIISIAQGMTKFRDK